MKKLVFATLFIATTWFVRAAAAAPPRVQAGEWETAMAVGTGKPMVTKFCITAADAKSMSGDEATLRKYLEESTDKNTGGRCAVKSVKLDGNRTVVNMVCGRTEIVTTTTYYGDRYEATTSNGAVVSGKRLGDCP